MKKKAKSKVMPKKQKQPLVKKRAASSKGDELAAFMVSVLERFESLDQKMEVVSSRLAALLSADRGAIPAVPPKTVSGPFPESRQSLPAQGGHFNRPLSPSGNASRPSLNPQEVPRPQTSGFDQRRSRALFPAVCADCRKNCEVPVKPTEGRPIYCKQCFSLRKSATAHHSPDRRSAVAYMARQSGQGMRAPQFSNKSDREMAPSVSVASEQTPPQPHTKALTRKNAVSQTKKRK